jgi:hypothetical protein
MSLQFDRFKADIRAGADAMDEYIFFDAGLRDSFVEFAGIRGVVCQSRDDTMGLVVAVPEDLDEELVDALEARYDELQDQQAELMSRTEGGLGKLAGFKLDLPDGRSCTVPLQPDIANRLLSCFSFEEIGALFDTVARSALDPRDDHLCELLRADTKAKRG